jgi:tRNA pseudouridine55 synthase
MIGSELGYPAHMSELVRIQSAALTLEDCLTFEEIEDRMEKGTFTEILRPMEAALSHLPKFQISDKVAEKVKNGAVLTIPDPLLDTKGPIAIETLGGLVLAIYEHHSRKPGLMKPVKVLRNDI